MSVETRVGLGIMLGALALGVLGDGLLRETPWGLNAALWVLALVGLGALLVWRLGLPLAGEGRWLVGPALLFAAALAWRDSPALKVCNVLAVGGLLALAALRLRSGRLSDAGLTEYGLGGALVGANVSAGYLALAGADVRWREISSDRWYGTPVAIGRGAALALPLLLAFGALLVAADAAFERLVTTVFRWSPPELLEHLFLTGLLAWGAAGLLRAGLVMAPWSGTRLTVPLAMTVGWVEVVVVLGLLDLLFGLFVGVQASYFFGGAAFVSLPSGPTYAEYARRGFFELVAVVALALPTLLVGHWLLRDEDRRARRAFTALAGGLIGLLLVVVASALFKMQLYVSMYGLTELRLYTSAFMLWLAVLLVWFVATVLRGRRNRFAVGALAAGCLVLLGLNGLNPDGLIARTNLARAAAAQSIDVVYLGRLSADAVPDLVAGLPSLEPRNREVLALALLRRWSPPAEPDFRTWSWGRYRAWWAVTDDRANLESLAARVPPPRR